MADHVHMQCDDVRTVAKAVKSTGSGLSAAAEYAKEADPDPYMWGAVGAPLGIVYEEAATTVQDMLSRLPDALNGVADRINAAVDKTEDCDGKAARDLDGILNDLLEAG
ncbi:type VII secretion target [Salininema proteolyticum]|uniref:Type VII secretion target n=1 Tax=Salininema proteolyticum TaxID=1607685 RepID=A0ABV8U449_9ACTN